MQLLIFEILSHRIRYTLCDLYENFQYLILLFPRKLGFFYIEEYYLSVYRRWINKLIIKILSHSKIYMQIMQLIQNVKIRLPKDIVINI